MSKKMLIDAAQAEETRLAILNGGRLDYYDFEVASRRQLKGNIYLAKVTRVEPSLQAAFIEYGGNRQGFLAFNEIHPDYYRIPMEDREAIMAAEFDEHDEDDARIFDKSHKVHSSDDYQPDADALELDTPNQPHTVTDLADSDSALEDGLDEPLLEDGLVQEVPKDPTTETIGGIAADEDEEEDAERIDLARKLSRLRRRYKIQEVIKRGQIMLVQATKEERGGKGAAMTTYISLAGRYCVLMPNSPRGGGISRKIDNPGDRRRLRDLLSALNLPLGMSVILRTAGLQRGSHDIHRDLDYLLRMWDSIRETTMQSVAPALVYEEGDIFKRAVRDLYSKDIEEIVVSGVHGFHEIKNMMRMLVPLKAKNVQFYEDARIPLFQRYQIESQATDVFKPRVDLPSGGYIIINPTEALVSIDVNSGKSTRERHIDDTAIKTNLEAADEVARQLRLRDLGGLVVVDFIDMENPRHNTKVERRMKDALSQDRARIEVGRISAFGLLELSRQRLRPSIMETQFEPCPYCSGTGSIRTEDAAALVVTRALEEEAVKGRAISLTAHVPERTAVHLLNQKRDVLLDMEAKYGCQIAVRIETNLMPDDYRIEYVKGQPLLRPVTEEEAEQRRKPTIDWEAERLADEAAIEAAGGADALAEETATEPQGNNQLRRERNNNERGNDRADNAGRNRRGNDRRVRNGDATDIAEGEQTPAQPMLDEHGNPLPMVEGEEGNRNNSRRRQRFEKWRERRNERREQTPQLDENGNPLPVAEGSENNAPRAPRVRRNIPIQTLDENGQPITAPTEEGAEGAGERPRNRRNRGGRNRNRGRNGENRAPRTNGDSVARLSDAPTNNAPPTAKAPQPQGDSTPANDQNKKRGWWQRLVE